MASQPANTQIKVYRTLRSFRRADRQEAIASLTKRLRPQVMSIPGREDLVEYTNRNSNFTDFSPYMGEASVTALRGYPIVVGLRDQVSLSNAQGNIPGVGFGFKIGQDVFLEHTEANLGRDLHRDGRNLSQDVQV